MLTFIGRLLAPYAIKIAGWLAIAAAVAAILLGARSAGKTAAKVEGLKRQLDSVKERADVEIDVIRQPDGAAADRLRAKWSRD